MLLLIVGETLVVIVVESLIRPLLVVVINTLVVVKSLIWLLLVVIKTLVVVVKSLIRSLLIIVKPLVVIIESLIIEPLIGSIKSQIIFKALVKLWISGTEKLVPKLVPHICPLKFVWEELSLDSSRLRCHQ